MSLPSPRPLLLLVLVGPLALAAVPPGQESERAPRTAAEVIAASTDDEWRSLDPEETVYIELEGGRVVIELAPEFAPLHVANIRALVRGGYFDGGSIQRSQDNYVAQWGIRPLADGETLQDSVARSLPAEFEVEAAGLPFSSLPDGDVYAEEVGFVRGFPVGREPAAGIAWMAHCYGVVGVARGNDPGSGSGGSLYAVTGHSPRHLDRNLSMVGRVVEGMEHLSTLPRGTGNLGFYESPEERTVLGTVRVGSDLPPEERAPIEIMRTDSRSFQALVRALRTRAGPFFVHPTGRIELCNVRVPSRAAGSD